MRQSDPRQCFHHGRYRTVHKWGKLIIADQHDAKESPDGQDASFFCSELVFRAFEVAGALLTQKPAHRMSPHSLFHTYLLAFMGRLV